MVVVISSGEILFTSLAYTKSGKKGRAEAPVRLFGILKVGKCMTPHFRLDNQPTNSFSFNWIDAYIQNILFSQVTLNDIAALRDELFVAQRERKQALEQSESQLHEAYTIRKSQEVANETILKLQTENEGFLEKIEALKSELQDVNKEAKDATR